MSEQKVFNLEPGSSLTIKKVGGDLTLKGWNQPRLKVMEWSGSDQTASQPDHLALEISGDAVLYAPHDLALTIHNVGGDAVLKGLQSSLSIEKVGGDLFLSDLHQAQVNKIGGDVFAKHLRNDLTIRNCGGDCTVQDVDGQLAVEKAGGDVLLSDIGGGLTVTAAGGITASLSPVSWQAYALESGGDLDLQLPEGANAEIACQSRDRVINLFLEDQTETITEKEHNLTLGEGGASLALKAGGEITVSTREETWAPRVDFELDFNADLSGMAEEITSQTFDQIEEHLSDLEDQLQESLGSLAEVGTAEGLEKDLHKLQQKIAKSSQKTAQKAQKAAQKAQANLQKRIARAQRKARQQAKKSSGFDLESFLSDQDQETKLEKERMMILNMLQEKKITAEQADELLAALEEKE